MDLEQSRDPKKLKFFLLKIDKNTDDIEDSPDEFYDWGQITEVTIHNYPRFIQYCKGIYVIEKDGPILWYRKDWNLFNVDKKTIFLLKI